MRQRPACLATYLSRYVSGKTNALGRMYRMQLLVVIAPEQRNRAFAFFPSTSRTFEKKNDAAGLPYRCLWCAQRAAMRVYRAFTARSGCGCSFTGAKGHRSTAAMPSRVDRPPAALEFRPPRMEHHCEPAVVAPGSSVEVAASAHPPNPSVARAVGGRPWQRVRWNPSSIRPF